MNDPMKIDDSGWAPRKSLSVTLPAPLIRRINTICVRHELSRAEWLKMALHDACNREEALHASVEHNT